MSPPVADQLAATADAFDSVAPTYDGPQGNNALIQRMREIVWQRVNAIVPTPSTLVDLGCGTGIDAQYFAGLGHQVIATDWSPAMVERAERRQVGPGAGTITAARIGAHELHLLNARGDYTGRVDLSYSNFGPLNCVPDLNQTARSLAEITRPGGHAVFTVIGRYCPWEMAHYVRRRRWRRAVVRLQRGSTAVGMNGHTIWTRYFSPREFVREWIGADQQWELASYESLSLFVPPPYLDSLPQRRPGLFSRLVAIDRRTARWPLMRGMGDHFLVVLRRR